MKIPSTSGFAEALPKDKVQIAEAKLNFEEAKKYFESVPYWSWET